MGLGLLLFPALGGYWTLTRANRWTFRAVRLNGYSLVFSSACIGALLVGVSWTSLLLVSLFIVDVRWVVSCLPGWSQPPDLIHIAAVTGTAIGFCLPYGLNRGEGDEEKETYAKEAAKEREDQIELLLQEAAKRPMTVEISLENRKSYVGFVTESGIFSKSDEEPDIALLPVVSGYRDLDTMKLGLHTDYRPFYVKLVERSLKRGVPPQASSRSTRDMRLVLPLSSVRSARLFDLGLYDSMKGKQ